MRILILLAALAAPVFAQCGKMVINPTTGRLDCIGTGGGGGSGTVTSVGFASMPPWLAASVATATTTPSITIAGATAQTAHKVVGTCGAATTVALCSLVAGDIPALSYQAPITTGTSDQYLNGVLGLGSWVNCVASGGVLQYSTTSHAVSCHTLVGADLPNPGASSLGGVQSKDCTGTGHILKIGTDGTVTCSSDAGGSPAAGAAISVSGSTVSFNPLDTSMDFLFEDFASAGSGASNNIGLLRWTAAGTINLLAPSGVHAGLIAASTTAAANNVGYLALWGGGCCGVNAEFQPIGGAPFTATNWETKWIFKTPASVSNVKIRVGWMTSAANVDVADASASGVFLRYANDGGTGCTQHSSDTTWVAFAGDVTNTVTGTLGSITAATWYTLDIKSTSAGTIVFTLTADGGSPTTASLVNTSGSPGTVASPNSIPALQVITCESVIKQVVVDEYRWLQTGIAR